MKVSSVFESNRLDGHLLWRGPQSVLHLELSVVHRALSLLSQEEPSSTSGVWWGWGDGEKAAELDYDTKSDFKKLFFIEV